MAYSTHVTATLVPLFMEDLAKVIVDSQEQTGDLKLILQTPFVREPQEIRSAEEFAVIGKKIVNKK